MTAPFLDHQTEPAPVFLINRTSSKLDDQPVPLHIPKNEPLGHQTNGPSLLGQLRQQHLGRRTTHTRPLSAPRHTPVSTVAGRSCRSGLKRCCERAATHDSMQLLGRRREKGMSREAVKSAGKTGNLTGSAGNVEIP